MTFLSRHTQISYTWVRR